MRLLHQEGQKIKNPEMLRVLKYACEYYISGFETEIDNLIRLFEYYKVKVTGVRKDLLREALENVEPYRLQFEEVVNTIETNPFDQTQSEQISEESRSSEDDDDIAEVELPQVGRKIDEKVKQKSVSERWAEAEDNAEQRTANETLKIALSVRERWEQAVRQAELQKDVKTRDLDR